MNERIKELFKQTSLHRNDHTTEQRLHEVEKFAESLIKECIKLVEGVEPSYKDYRSQIEESMRAEIVFVLKENFGIKE
jgi:hypothetical protein